MIKFLSFVFILLISSRQVIIASSEAGDADNNIQRKKNVYNAANSLAELEDEPLHLIPFEAWEFIANFLKEGDLLSFEKTCLIFRNVAVDLWKKLGQEKALRWDAIPATWLPEMGARQLSLEPMPHLPYKKVVLQERRTKQLTRTLRYYSWQPDASQNDDLKLIAKIANYGCTKAQKVFLKFFTDTIFSPTSIAFRGIARLPSYHIRYLDALGPRYVMYHEKLFNDGKYKTKEERLELAKAYLYEKKFKYNLYGGIGVEGPIDELLKPLLEEGDLDAGYLLALDGDKQGSIGELRLVAEKGHPKASYIIGRIYELGYGVEKSKETALMWYTAAAAEGYAKAQYTIGLIHEEGEWIPQDSDKAMVWYERAAQQGFAQAQCALARIFSQGSIVAQDYTKSHRLYTIAAHQEYAAAEFELGILYENGEGVEQDYQKAAFWYTRAAEQGDEVAQFNLSQMYYEGRGIKQDKKKALDLLNRAADRGSSEAQLELGVIYEEGEEVKQDYQKAAFWYTKAAEQENPEAQSRLSYLNKSLLKIKGDL